MKFYLSSYKLGNSSAELPRLMGTNKKMGYIPNAGYYKNGDKEKFHKINETDMTEIKDLGIDVELLDLKDYFGKIDALREKISSLGGVFVRGGNTFSLRQAMRLSGFDVIFDELKERDDFVYSGYSAGVCVLAKSMKSLQIVDFPEDNPYEETQETIWEGLGYFNYMILPHYDSDHSESSDIDKEIEYCIKNKELFLALKDGEVIVLE